MGELKINCPEVTLTRHGQADEIFTLQQSGKHDVVFGNMAL